MPFISTISGAAGLSSDNLIIKQSVHHQTCNKSCILKKS
ncbi:hypothetical protein SALWKB2_1571 [Snodgrassella alvi wkB2]|nr:hypothetical protein SALWKB2_1571 [Snodgrassella alvi wkB2]